MSAVVHWAVITAFLLAVATARGEPVPTADVLGSTPTSGVTPTYDVLGSIDVGTGESTIFLWRNKLYILENIFCGYVDHYGQWNATFQGKSYARIRELHSGVIVSNVSETVGTSFVSAFVDTEHDRVWLSALAEDRCKSQGGTGVLAISSSDLRHWKLAMAVPNVRTYNTQVRRSHSNSRCTQFHALSAPRELCLSPPPGGARRRAARVAAAPPVRDDPRELPVHAE